MASVAAMLEYSPDAIKKLGEVLLKTVQSICSWHATVLGWFLMVLPVLASS